MSQWPDQISQEMDVASTLVLIIQMHPWPPAKPRHPGSEINTGAPLSCASISSGELQPHPVQSG